MALTGKALMLFNATPLKKTLTPSSLTLVLMQSRIPLYVRPPASDIWRRAFTTSMGVAKAQDNTPANPPAVIIENIPEERRCYESSDQLQNPCPVLFTGIKADRTGTILKLSILHIVTFETYLALCPPLLEPHKSTRKTKNRVRSSASPW